MIQGYRDEVLSFSTQTPFPPPSNEDSVDASLSVSDPLTKPLGSGRMKKDILPRGADRFLRFSSPLRRRRRMTCLDPGGREISPVSGT